MNCPNCGAEIQDGANFCAQSGLPATKRRGGARSFFKWSAIGRGGLIGLFVIIAAIASSGCDAPSTASDTTPTPEEAYRAGAQAGESLKDSGRGLDHNLLQEAVAKAETEILGDSGMWDVSNSDIAAVCGYFVDIGKLIHDGEPVGNARNTLLEEAGPERSALFGAILTSTSSSQAFTDFCAPFNGYTAGFIKMFGTTSEIYELSLDGSAFVDDAIDSLSASELTNNEASFNKGVAKGISDGMVAANEAAKGTSPLVVEGADIASQPGAAPIPAKSPPSTESAGSSACEWSIACAASGLDHELWERVFQECEPNVDCRLQASTADISESLASLTSVESRQGADGATVYRATTDDAQRSVTWMDKDGVVFLDMSATVPYDVNDIATEVLLRSVVNEAVPAPWEFDVAAGIASFWSVFYTQPASVWSDGSDAEVSYGNGGEVNGVSMRVYYVPRLSKAGVVFEVSP